MQKRSWSHFFSSSMHAWIHMLCRVALNLATPWYFTNTSEVILQVLFMLYFMSLRYREKVMAMPLLHLGSEVLPIDVYHVLRQHPTLSQKYR
jgi:hypothetical protein